MKLHMKFIFLLALFPNRNFLTPKPTLGPTGVIETAPVLLLGVRALGTLRIKLATIGSSISLSEEKIACPVAAKTIVAVKADES